MAEIKAHLDQSRCVLWGSKLIKAVFSWALAPPDLQPVVDPVERPTSSANKKLSYRWETGRQQCISLYLSYFLSRNHLQQLRLINSEPYVRWYG